MFNSKWIINKIGLMDFWYYDDEQFIFEDGRMLLRGSNGSGKSVTMQSFIPLLLDANKSPGRLDPFGSRDRKLDNYMLEDGDGREERIGYLYMEFKRADSKTFKTIGMGIRAKKNKPLDTWYFNITDGRRIGKDINLYKKDRTSEKICFNKSELKTAIGLGGQVLEKQSEYMDMVNKQLFGFSTNEEYAELINLLIQLRTPKLSKDFKPTIINDILSGSLPALTEDDLRPMSEAIENMDVLKTTLDSLQESKKAADKISQVYNVYNNSVLFQKVEKYIEYKNESTKIESDFKKIVQEEIELKDVLFVTLDTISKLEQEEKALNEQKNNLEREHYDEMKIKENLDNAQIEAEIEKSQLDKKQKELSKNIEKQKDLEREIKDKKETIEILKDDILKIINDMSSISEDIEYSENDFMKKELIENFSTSYNFTFSKQKANSFEQEIKNGIELLKEEKIVKNKYEEILEKSHDLEIESKEKNIQIEQSNNQLVEVKAELIEKINLWSEQNTLLKLTNKTIESIVQLVSDYSYKEVYLDLKSITEQSYRTFLSDLNKQNAEKETQRDYLLLEKKQKEKELFELENSKEIEPQRTKEVINNRIWLEKLNIPYIPFYKILSFKDDVSEDVKNNIEDALIRMGILDALVISSEHKTTVLSEDIGKCDNYIFVNKNDVVDKKQNKKRNNISDIIFVDEKADNYADFSDMINIVLKSISLDSNSLSTNINLNGDFNIGILSGNLTKEYVCKFIGEVARQNNKLKTIENIKQELENIKNILSDLEKNIILINEKIENLNKEYNNIPDVKDIIIAADFIKVYENELEKINIEISNNEIKEKKIKEQLKIIKEKIYIFSSKTTLKLNLEVFIDALSDISDYKNHLSELEIEHNKYISQNSFIKTKEDIFEDINDVCDSIRYEQVILEKKIASFDLKIKGYIEQLKLTNYEDIKEQIDKYASRLRELPNSIKMLYDSTGKTRNEIITIEGKLKYTQKILDRQQYKNEMLKLVVLEEYNLLYTDFENFDIDDTNSLKNLNTYLEEQKGIRRDTNAFQVVLMEQFHKNIDRLTEYSLTMDNIFEENDLLNEVKIKRLDISCKIRGKKSTFNELTKELKEVIEQQEILFRQSDREIFEEILSDTIGKKISSRIYKSERWVEKMNDLMKNMNTSSGLALSLAWKNKKSETAEQLNTKDLVELLKKDSGLMKEKDTEKLAKHFRSKISESRKRLEENENSQTLHSIMREILDYRQWFEFQLSYLKTGETKKELTNKAFFQFSGGEKAMSMYVPLFSAVAAKYQGARPDAPHLISLDEAFAGVDDKNVQDMFRLMVDFDFNFIINSQVLWGDYETVPQLAIYQLHRPNNVKYVTTIRYVWNGSVKKVDLESDN